MDLAKDYDQQPILSTLEELVGSKKAELILPEVVVEEFHRNKARVIQESGRSLSSVFKRVKEAVVKHGDSAQKETIIEQLNNIDYKIPQLKEDAEGTILRIENLFKKSEIIKTTDAVKLRAANRAMDKRAPFHRPNNSINDAVIMETYADCIQSKNSTGNRFMFITHNTRDFSQQDSNNKVPHPDFSSYFSKLKSQYFIKLSEALYKINPKLISESMMAEEWAEEPRSLSEILEAEGEFFNKVWYNRHQYRLYTIENGEISIVDRAEYSHSPKQILKEIWAGARKSAKRVEKQYGVENLGPWDDFEWGMVNGKLSALRWVLGSEWDFLDT